MKKQVSLALAAVFSLSVAGVALAAPANPFIDVPANHWAYDALSQLQKDGVVTGYGDGTFRGDRNLTRYEMAAMIAKITMPGDDKNGPLIKRLQSEFATELYNLGVRVDKLEKNVSTIKITGYAHLHYDTNMAIGSVAPMKGSSEDYSRFRERIHLNMESDVNDNLKFLGAIRGEQISNYLAGSGSKKSSTNSSYFQRAEFKWTANKFTASAGRLTPTLGQGLIWGADSADGFLLGYNFNDKVNLEAGYLDLGYIVNGSGGASVNAFAANLGVKITDKINFTAAYLDVINPQDSASISLPDGYTFKQWAVGGDAKFGKDFKVIAEYVKNEDAPSHEQGAWGRFQWKETDYKKPGTFAVYADYMKLGSWAIDSDTFAHGLNIAGGNGIGADGAKGWGAGLQYVPAKNMQMDLSYYDMKTFDGKEKYKKSYAFTTHFYF